MQGDTMRCMFSCSVALGRLASPRCARFLLSSVSFLATSVSLCCSVRTAFTRVALR